MDLNEVVSKLKGPRGTTVKIKVSRPGVYEPIEMLPIRDEIAKYTINNAYMIRPRVGYIKLESFAETTGQELRDALRKLDVKNMDGLVFDLRNNPGGLLQEAIEVCETFLQKGQLIVETRGRTRGSNRPYASQKLNSENLFPVVVLINPQSASASEIVAGALQDHDRALIVGQTSFGKGLVQSIITIPEQCVEGCAGLTLTSAKYFTPSGRLIQRDYSNGDYYNYIYRGGTLRSGNDQSKPIGPASNTDTGRPAYGGGGNPPDEPRHPTPVTKDQARVRGPRFF